MSAGLRRRSVLGDARGRSGPMMTPMVDVVLVILIFFMASTTIAGYEWFLHASVETPTEAGTEQQSRFTLPAAVIDVDLVHTSDGMTLVYGISGDSGVSIDQASAMIQAMDLVDSGALRVGLGARDGVPMRDVMRIHDAWHERGVKVVMRVGG